MSVKLINENDIIVYKTIKTDPGITRPKIVQKTGIPRSTVFDSTARMIRRGIIRKKPEKRTEPGRPKIFYY